MQNITLSAPVDLIEAAREMARSRSTTLNAEFRIWLAQFTRKPSPSTDVMAFLDEIGQLPVADDRAKWTREDMNAR